jgi:hypothetical protein
MPRSPVVGLEMDMPGFYFPVLDEAFDDGARAYRTRGAKESPHRFLPLLNFAWELGWDLESFLEREARKRR